MQKSFKIVREWCLCTIVSHVLNIVLMATGAEWGEHVQYLLMDEGNNTFKRISVLLTTH